MKKKKFESIIFISNKIIFNLLTLGGNAVENFIQIYEFSVDERNMISRKKSLMRLKYIDASSILVQIQSLFHNS